MHTALAHSVPQVLAAARRVPFYKLFIFLFLASLPFINPAVHGDGVGYYAYARAPLIQHNFRFEEDWQRANSYFAENRTGPDARVRPDQYTVTGHIYNHFTVGPAILWAPFLVAAHSGVFTANALGAHIPADGFSTPYLVAMAFGTAIYGFLGLLFSYSLTKKYVEDRWAFLATLGVWLASSLAVYMYFNPSWSHAHSAFTAALFLWYWDHTRVDRETGEWIVLGLISGLMVDVYFPNGVFLLLPMLDALLAHRANWQIGDRRSQYVLLEADVAYTLAFLIAVAPTFVTRKIIFGGLFRLGDYTDYSWDWSAPHWREILFSSDHGIFSWTPLLLLATAGLLLGRRAARTVAAYLALAAILFYYVIACYPYWDGMSSFGNRFFISLTPIFIFGLALFFARFAEYFRSSRWPLAAAIALVMLFAAWNAGFIFQWGEHMIPVRGAISFRAMIHNQFHAVPQNLGTRLQAYLFNRKEVMKQIEERDIQQMKPSTERPVDPSGHEVKP